MGYKWKEMVDFRYDIFNYALHVLKLINQRISLATLDFCKLIFEVIGFPDCSMIFKRLFEPV